MGGRAARALFGLYAAAVGVALVLPITALALALCRTPRAAWRLVRWPLRLAGAVTGLGPDLRVAAGAGLPPGPFVAVSNHASLLDVPALMAALGEPVAFTAKREIFGWPLVGPFARRIGAIPVERGSLRRRADALRAAGAAARSGRVLHVFPEATLSPHPGLLPFRPGAFRLAREEGLPVVPIAILGTRRALPPGALLPRPSRIEVRVLPALEPPQRSAGPRGLTEIRDRARRALAAALGEPLLPATLLPRR